MLAELIKKMIIENKEEGELLETNLGKALVSIFDELINTKEARVFIHRTFETVRDPVQSVEAQKKRKKSGAKSSKKKESRRKREDGDQASINSSLADSQILGSACSTSPKESEKQSPGLSRSAFSRTASDASKCKRANEITSACMKLINHAYVTIQKNIPNMPTSILNFFTAISSSCEDEIQCKDIIGELFGKRWIGKHAFTTEGKLPEDSAEFRMSKILSAVLSQEFLQYDNEDLVAKEYSISCLNDYIDKKRAPSKLFKKLSPGIKGPSDQSSICISKHLINQIYGLMTIHRQNFVELNPDLESILSDLEHLQGETDIFSVTQSSLNKSQENSYFQNLMQENIRRKQSEDVYKPPTSPFVVFNFD